MNVRHRVNLFTGGRISLHAGGVSVVSQSGFLLRSTLAAGQQRQHQTAVGVLPRHELAVGEAEGESRDPCDSHRRFLRLDKDEGVDARAPSTLRDFVT
jgi:hypothetical protein